MDLKYLIKKFDLYEETEDSQTKIVPPMKVKTNHELFFEFQNQFGTLAQFTKTKTAESIVKEIETIAKIYFKKNLTVMLESDSTRLAFDKMLRCIKHPYMTALYSGNGSEKTSYDRGSVNRNLLSSFNDAIIELDITVSDKQKAINETNKMIAAQPTIQSNLNFEA